MIDALIDYDDALDSFDFLDNLRESGTVNMFGVAKELMDIYGFTKQEAKEVQLGWMSTFNPERPSEVRADEWWASKYEDKEDV